MNVWDDYGRLGLCGPGLEPTPGLKLGTDLRLSLHLRLQVNYPARGEAGNPAWIFCLRVCLHLARTTEGSESNFGRHHDSDSD